MFEEYEHKYGDEKTAIVWVRSHLKGRHREHCLCWSCAWCNPGTPGHCKQAQLLYAVCCAFDMVTPVWECPDFEEKAE